MLFKSIKMQKLEDKKVQEVRFGPYTLYSPLVSLQENVIMFDLIKITLSREFQLVLQYVSMEKIGKYIVYQ